MMICWEIAPEFWRRDTRQLRFLWVGDGSLRERFEERMNQMELRDRFILTGMVPPGAKCREWRRQWISWCILRGGRGWRGRSRRRRWQEIQAITYDIDGAKEAVVYGVTGFVIRPFDQKLSQAIGRLVEDVDLRKSMASAANLPCGDLMRG